MNRAGKLVKIHHRLPRPFPWPAPGLASHAPYALRHSPSPCHSSWAGNASPSHSDCASPDRKRCVDERRAAKKEKIQNIKTRANTKQKTLTEEDFKFITLTFTLQF